MTVSLVLVAVTCKTPGVILTMYQVDCLKVWELISEITCGMDCWSYVKPYQCTINGRLTFQKL